MSGKKGKLLSNLYSLFNLQGGGRRRAKVSQQEWSWNVFYAPAGTGSVTTPSGESLH